MSQRTCHGIPLLTPTWFKSRRFITFFCFGLPQERNRLKYLPVAKILSRILNPQTLPFWQCIQILARSISGRTERRSRIESPTTLNSIPLPHDSYHCGRIKALSTKIGLSSGAVIRSARRITPFPMPALWAAKRSPNPAKSPSRTTACCSLCDELPDFGHSENDRRPLDDRRRCRV